MPPTVELPDALADALADEASRAGLTLPDYAARLLAAWSPVTARMILQLGGFTPGAG